MKPRDVTALQLDPLGTVVSRHLSWLAAATALVLGVAQAVIGVSLGGQVTVAWAAAFAIAGSAAVVISAGRQWFTRTIRTAQLWIVLLGGLGVALSHLSIWGLDPALVPSLTPAAFGLLILGLAPFSSTRQLIGISALGAILIGLLADVQAYAAASVDPPIVFAVIAASAVLGPGIASAVGSTLATTTLRSWQSLAIVASREHALQMRDGIARSVQQERVTLLNLRVLPLLTDLLEQGEVTEAVQEHARAMADRLRAAMVAEAERSWLDTLVEQIVGSLVEEHERTVVRVADPEHRADLMAATQRTALRAYVEALTRLEAFRPEGFRIDFQRKGEADLVTVAARLDPSVQRGHGRLDPFVAVMKSTFPQSTIKFTPNSVVMRFRYVTEQSDSPSTPRDSLGNPR